MHSQTKIEYKEQAFQVTGDLVFSTVLDLIDKVKEQLDQLDSDNIEINLESVKRIDSAGIALLIGWKRDCLASNKICNFQEIPQQAISLLGTYKLLDIVNNT